MSTSGETQLPVQLYVPESPLRHPAAMLRQMVADLSSARELAWRLFVRDLSAQYRQSLLGYVWLFLPPLATTLVWALLNEMGVLNVSETGVPYPVFVLTGTLLWESFVLAMNSPLTAVQGAASMLTKIRFPHEALLLTAFGQTLFTTVIRLLLLVGIFIWYQVPVPVTIVLAPLGVVALVALGFMVGLLLVPLGMLYQDVIRGLSVATGLLFFITPVVYPAPTSWPASLLTSINPVGSLILFTRDVLTTGSMAHAQGALIVSTLAVTGLLVGWVLFRLAMPHLISRISA